jgi:transcription antitermination factor NusG
MFENKLAWYALRVRSRHEQVTAAVLAYKGYEHFVPTYKERRQRCDRYQTVDVPLFPGYVFCRFDVHDRLPVVTVRGLVNIVGIGKIPYPIDDREIGNLQIAMASGHYVQPWPFLNVGDRVLLKEGPLRDLEGIVVQEKGATQLVLSINLLQRSVAVTLDRAWVRPIPARPATREHLAA